VHDWPFAAALAVILMIMTSIIIGIYRRISRTQEREKLA
jgi:spermidine/putrescine transport system permease protein